jgi:UDP-glucose 4-epimerase
LGETQPVTRYFVAGGSGFIGSHLVHTLLQREDVEVTVFDNLVSGHRWYLEEHLDDPRVRLVESDLKDFDAVVERLEGCETAFHFAANPDIAKAVTDPAVDFWEGTLLAHNVMEACRINGVRRIVYASGSGVYGDRGDRAVDEEFGPLYPVSTYGASKLAVESMLSAYCHMFEMQAACFRFANVVGPRQTHGVTYDFVRKLLADPNHLEIFGDGSQSKSYIHVSDVVAAMLLLVDQGWDGFEVFNAGTDDYVTVHRIADLTAELLGLEDVEYRFTGGKRGWKGDVPVVRFDSTKLRSRGWTNRLTSEEALADSIRSNITEAGREPAPR